MQHGLAPLPPAHWQPLLPTPQLDTLLLRLLPTHAAEAPASAALVATLLQRTETVVQPYLQVCGEWGGEKGETASGWGRSCCCA